MPIQIIATAHGFDGFERESAGKHREAPQQLLLRLGKEVVAPVDQRTQYPGAGRGLVVALSAETVVEARRIADGNPRPRGGKLDRSGMPSSW